MTRKIAAIRLADVRREARRASAACHLSQDNFPVSLRAAGERRRAMPALACHWVALDGGILQCRWETAAVRPPAAQCGDGIRRVGVRERVPVMD